jgi:riboflavin kinase/FMN adenylyltransferase
MIKVYRNIESVPFIKKAVITVGTFDGIHLAHRVILNEVVRSAKNMQGKSIVITFTNHPRTVIDPNFQIKILTSSEEKNIFLQKIGIDIVIYVDFTPTFAKTDYSNFIKSLTSKINIQKFIVGYNHNFGKNKEGNIRNLEEISLLYGFEVVEIPQQTIDGTKISSSRIREAINAGDLNLANKLLGYNHLSEN